MHACNIRSFFSYCNAKSKGQIQQFRSSSWLTSTSCNNNHTINHFIQSFFNGAPKKFEVAQTKNSSRVLYTYYEQNTKLDNNRHLDILIVMNRL